MRAASIAVVALVVAAATAAAATAAAATAGDPRLPVVELQLAGEPAAALAAVEAALAADPAAGHELGLGFLRAHLLAALGRDEAAREAWAASLGTTPRLAPWARLELAAAQTRLGHPEVAAGLLANLIDADLPRDVVAAAARRLRVAIEAGGDCRLLGGVDTRRLRDGERRQVELATAGCAVRGGDRDTASARYLALLHEDTADDVGRLAAVGLVALDPEPRAAETARLVGTAFFEHREFDQALPYLARAVAAERSGLGARELWETRYAMARSHFWESRFGAAAAAFRAVAADAADPPRRARALFQEGRSHELAGDWDRALEVFAEVGRVVSTGGWAEAASAARLRLAWLLGDQRRALGELDSLLRHRRDDTASRALLFLAASELVAGRAERARGWLDRAEELDEAPRVELAYWRGRLHEVAGEEAAAVHGYLAALASDPFHPHGRAARGRLLGPGLAAAATARAAELAGSRNAGDLLRAWLLLAEDDPRGRRARGELEGLLARDAAHGAFLALQPVPPAAWPLWRARLDAPEETLAALGRFAEGGAAVVRHFPAARPDLAYTGSLLLSESGAHRRALYLAEILAKRVPETLPEALLPAGFRRLLYPFGYGDLIRRETRRREVDPYLLAAIVREESRFDAAAFSGASARGLTQFVLPTARRVAGTVGLEFTPERLEDPEVAIVLGAAYLGELHHRFDGAVERAIAAYNAGEPQAELWGRYCTSHEPEEYLTKIVFSETRAYVRKVLTSRAHYRHLYGAGTPPAGRRPVTADPDG